MIRRTMGMAVIAMGLGAGAAAMAQGLPPAPPVETPMVRVPLPSPSAADAAGGVPSGAAAAGTLPLSLSMAVQRGLQFNLGPLVAQSETEAARAQRLAAISALLPHVDASAGELRQKLNLAAFGLSFPGVPAITGPFDVFQASVAANVPVLNLSAIQNARAARGAQMAAQQDYQSVRNMVVLAVANQYLLSVADESRVAAARAELATAQSQLQQARDRLRAGTVDALAAVRAQVQRDRQRQLLTAAQDAVAKQRLQLARAVGLPLNQRFQLTTRGPFQPLPAPSPAAAEAEALAQRPDYRAAQETVRAARLALAAARDQRLPTFSLNGNYGTIGHELDSNHPIFEVGATLSMPVFEGGAIRAQALAAQAQLRQAENRAADLRAAIGVQVRSALLDLADNRSQVAVALDARNLARQELTLAEDRFRAGVADNLEVVEAQQSVADADESYISSLYGYNLAKASLAEALGVAATDYTRYLPNR
jgi:outer membrane protein TolC